MFFVIGLSLACPINAVENPDQNPSPEESKIQIIRPESYAIRRFSEIIETEMDERSEPATDRLIQNRALFEISKKKLLDLKDLSLESDSQNLKNKIKAWEARTDYFRKRIKFLEEKIKKDRNK